MNEPKGDDLILASLSSAEKAQPSPLRAAMAKLDARLNGRDRRVLRRAQHKVNGTKESFAAMSARLQKRGDC